MSNKPHVSTGDKSISSPLRLLMPHLLHTATPRIVGWFQLRKRAARRLKILSGDTVVLAEDGYRGHHARHWMRHACGCLFHASLSELAGCNPDEICPCCGVSSLKHLSRFGRVDSVRELVWIMTSGNLDFAQTNPLGPVSADYEFVCQIHNFSFPASFAQFVSDPDGLCPICSYWVNTPPPQLLKK